MTTALAAGPNGPQLDRTLINAWLDSRVREAVTRTGRNKVIIAGTGLNVCAQLPALACAAEGYDAYVAIDACGRFAAVPSVATISRLTQGGVTLADTRVAVLEAMADNAQGQRNLRHPGTRTGGRRRRP
jgi:nicotinamidase-related amidase